MSHLSKEAVESIKWFHAIDFGGITSKSWLYKDNLPPNYHLYSVYHFLENIRINGLDCLDLGTYDGLIAFILRKLGGNVTATCQYEREQFRFCQKVFGFDDIDYIPRFHIEHIEKDFMDRKFDLIILGSILHHLISPLDALITCRNLMKENGLLILEAAFLPGDLSSMTLNTESEDPVYGCPNIWMPTQSTLAGMLKFSSFNIVGEAELTGTHKALEKNYNRMTFLAKATKPSQVAERTLKLIELHESTAWTGNINFNALEKSKTNESRIQYAGERKHIYIDIWNYQTNLPLQPKWPIHQK